MDQFDPLEDDDFDSPPPDRPLTASDQKLQRWVDLLAALLVRQRHATFDELARDVSGYDLTNDKRESVLRTFERDKDELRRFGVPIETVKDSDGEPIGYRLERKAFYLPYLMVASHERSSAPRKSYDGYRSLETLAFEPDELDAIVEAAARVRSLGDPVLAAETDAALRKLALDLPLGAVFDLAAAKLAEPAVVFELTTRTMMVPPRRVPDGSIFERLSDALARRKAVTFDYLSMERGERSRRSVQPYGLFFVSSHWYLAGYDTERDGLRNFRLSRVSNLAVNTRRAQSADYDVPESFSLRSHAQSREPWEIGDGDATSAVVEFIATTGATLAALALGTPVKGSAIRRRFDVRRRDAFARWLLSFGGDARPIEPPELVHEYQRVAAATLESYRDASTGGTLA